MNVPSTRNTTSGCSHHASRRAVTAKPVIAGPAVESGLRIGCTQRRTQTCFLAEWRARVVSDSVGGSNQPHRRAPATIECFSLARQANRIRPFGSCYRRSPARWPLMVRASAAIFSRVPFALLMRLEARRAILAYLAALVVLVLRGECEMNRSAGAPQRSGARR